MSATVNLPDGTLCVGQFYALSSDYIGQGPVRWVSLTRPEGIQDSDITYLGGGRANALVSVPVEGTYSFALECCEPV